MNLRVAAVPAAAIARSELPGPQRVVRIELRLDPPHGGLVPQDQAGVLPIEVTASDDRLIEPRYATLAVDDRRRVHVGLRRALSAGPLTCTSTPAAARSAVSEVALQRILDVRRRPLHRDRRDEAHRTPRLTAATSSASSVAIAQSSV